MKFNVKVTPERRKDKSGELFNKNIPLFADIRFAGIRVFYFTGYRVNVNWDNPSKGNWDLTKEEMKKNSSGMEGKRIVQYNDINNRIRAIKAELELFFQGTNTASKEAVIALLDITCKKSIQKVEQDDSTGFLNLFEHYLAVINISDVRKRNIRSTLNHWKGYAKKRGIQIVFEIITADLLRDFELFLSAESTKPKKKADGTVEMIPAPKGVNTIHKTMAMTRAFWNFAEGELNRNGIIIPSPFGKKGYKIPSEVYGDPIYISTEERNCLFNSSLTSERLQKVRDIFVFQCLIGARVGDLCKLTKANIQGNVLSYIPRKTKDDKPVTVLVPLSKKAVEILNKYDIPDGRLLPFITDQRYNVYLKELFKEVGLTRMVTRINPTTGEPEQMSIADIANSHMARKTFIGNLYGKVDTGIISSMSGHVEGSKSFARYRVASPDLQRQAIDLID